MRHLVILIALVWAALNALVAYTLFTSGLDPKAAAKGLSQQMLLWSAGGALGLFSALLVLGALRSAVSRPAD
ncbi:MAG: hypothetical protein U0821_16445 [Chloroflexota bacterium]